MKCENCNTVIVDLSKFCPECGEKITQSDWIETENDIIYKDAWKFYEKYDTNPIKYIGKNLNIDIPTFFSDMAFNLFEGTSIKSIKFPAEVNRFTSEFGCNLSELETIELERISYMGDFCFKSCPKLNTVIIHNCIDLMDNTQNRLPEGIFSDCPNVTFNISKEAKGLESIKLLAKKLERPCIVI